MANTNSSKGNPASTRMGNPRRKLRRQESWLRGQARKRANAAKNEAQHKANVAAKACGELTPHEQQRALRTERRNALRLLGTLPPIGLSRGRVSTPPRPKKPPKRGRKA